MVFARTLKRIYDSFIHDNNFLTPLVILFLLIAGYFFLSWPIVAYDTDLWYHLSGGRYFAEHHAVAKDAYFSYVSPPKSWYNYYWLFQIIVYAVYSFFDYYGLIILRCVLYLATIYLIYCFLVKNDDSKSRWIISITVFLCISMALTQRELLVRPHLFSYFFIVLFLYVLEKKPEKACLLPVIGILWSNIHGAEYPVMIVMVIAYLLEILITGITKDQPHPLAGRKSKWSLIAVCYTIFLTPGIIELVQSPFYTSFVNARYQHLYILELIPVQFQNMFIFAGISAQHIMFSLQNAIVIITIGCSLLCLIKRRMQVSHAIMLLAAFVLLSQHSRFVYEFILLSLPVIRNGLTSAFANVEIKRRWNLALPILLIAVPISFYGSLFKYKPAYPLSQLNLPTGITAFLNHAGVGGRVLNDPNTGGYLQWALDKKYKIFMDMELSLFNDTDFFLVANAFYDESAFKYVIRKYDPSFITVSQNCVSFKKMIGLFTQFVPIFFDDAEILFVNKIHFPTLSAQYALEKIDPFNYRKINYEGIDIKDLPLFLEEALKINRINPNNGATNFIAGDIYLIKKEYQKALTYADQVIRCFPDHADGYALKGDTLLAQDKFREAVSYYKMAIARGNKSDSESIYRNLFVAYEKLNEYKKAYKVFSDIVNPFRVTSNYKDIYQLGLSAAAAGKLTDGIIFLKLALIKCPSDDMEYGRKIRDALATLDPVNSKTIF